MKSELPWKYVLQEVCSVVDSFIVPDAIQDIYQKLDVEPSCEFKKKYEYEGDQNTLLLLRSDQASCTGCGVAQI